MKIQFFIKTINGKLIIYSEKLIIMYQLFPSELTKIHIATKANETNTEKKSFKKARCCCNKKVTIEF